MGGRDEWMVPSVGREHAIITAEARWEIRPTFAQTNVVDAYSDERGLAPSDSLSKADMGAIYERCLGFLNPEQRAEFDTMRAEQQRLVCSKLYRIHLEISDGVVRPNPGEDVPPLQQAEQMVGLLREELAKAETRLAQAQAEAAMDTREVVATADPTS